MNPSGAWYAQSGTKARELYTIMHLPYTSMVLSYVLIGASLAPSLDLTRVVLTLLAYFLGLGISAHALNELHARHWGDELTRTELQILSLAPLVGALMIGSYGMSVVFESSGSVIASLVLLFCIALETFFVFAYNTDFSAGRFHSDWAFAFSWGALPTIISYYANALTITVPAILLAGAMAATAGIEINLSRWCKEFRRKTPLAKLQFADETELNMKTSELIAKPERALKLIVVVVDLVALGLILHRLLI